METSRPQKRIEFIDIFRSMGILLMVMGHIGFGDRFYHFIHAFHMPMFFIISGYFYRPTTKEELPFGTFLKKKVKTLLIPYVVFGIGHYLYSILPNLLAHQPFSINPLKHLFFVNTKGMPICGALWFLTALFFTDIIFFLLDRYITNKKVASLVVILMASFGTIAKKILPFTLPFALSASFVGVGLYGIGYLMKKYQSNRILHTAMNLTWLQSVIAGVMVTILIFLNICVNMRQGVYGNLLLFWINATGATLVLWNLSRFVESWIGSMWIGTWLKDVGKNSIVYVCLNQIVILKLTEWLSPYILMPMGLKGIILFTSLVVLYGLTQLIIKTPLKVIVGK